MTEPAALIIIALLIIITVIIIHIWMDKENVSMEITTSTIITPMMSEDVTRHYIYILMVHLSY